MSIKTIVCIYILRIRPQAHAELDWFRQQPTLASAIEYAALAIDSKGKKYSHQWRIKKLTLEQAKQVLLANLRAIQACNNFNDLFLLVDTLLQPISGAGELYTYDTSLRIGAKLNLLPMIIYLHRGTRVGAKALGVYTKEKTIEVSKLPRDLQQLEPYEIEDFLCIFKDKFKEINTEILEEDLAKSNWCG